LKLTNFKLKERLLILLKIEGGNAMNALGRHIWQKYMDAMPQYLTIEI